MSDHAPQGFVRTYLFSTDHKTIGKQYMFTALFMAFFSIAWSVLIRLQIAWPGGDHAGGYHVLLAREPSQQLRRRSGCKDWY